MTKPDRLSRMVRVEVSKYFGPDGTDDAYIDALVLRLLRRELARTVRIVQRQPHVLEKSLNLINREDLLAALTKKEKR